MNKMRGSIVALITPMTPSGAVDEQALRRLVDFHVAAGTVALVSVGTTGESATLDEAEHCDVIARTLEMAAGRIPVIAGTGANSTTEAIRLTRCAKEAGADAALLVTPYYNKPTQEGLYQHHKAVAEAVDLPQLLYNVPGRTACDLKPETVARLARVSNIVGLKEATGDVTRVPILRALCGEDFLLYSGDDGSCCDFMLAGGDGVISVTSNLVPDKMQAMCVAALAGDADQARAFNSVLDPLHQGLFVESNPIPVKWALAEMGLCQPGIRLPLTWLSEPYHGGLRASLRDLGCIGD
ncbi:4-hydroxy-tetrahydrodipicolinate synthase [Thiorhodovibrio winogradskyi]|uniref:4-hydroxy-tetrahydrodipicolinate synthase n=1 Tax=Thiorhodovibrio winogradskyi TaxID=77007 RepID=A0ABZ0S9N4_9GAMM|nr:4-hydroxy-tetrahydrodipicolinate synthase [Thiorhodovibrio winogradskyi]